MTESIQLNFSRADFKSIITDVVKQAVAEVNQANTHTTQELKFVLTRKEVSDMLGGVSTPTLMKWDKDGYLKSFHMGRKVRYTLADVQAFIENRSKAAA